MFRGDLLLVILSKIDEAANHFSRDNVSALLEPVMKTKSRLGWRRL
jgi:hypothetical protein